MNFYRLKRAAVFLLFLCLVVSFAACGAKESKTVVLKDPDFNPVMPTGPEKSEIEVKAIPGLGDDFIKGMDASAVLSCENSGAVYYSQSGEVQDVYKTLAEAGINYIRLRVWNDPYDENGYGYGGGNNDLNTALELGKRATTYGMKVCIDFHYSDFWSDPKRQHCPKAWAQMNLDEKSEALYSYTKDSLEKLLDAGVDVSMVQIGNEINNGMAGEKSSDSIIELLKSGSRATREISEKYQKDIKIVVHYTNVNQPSKVYNNIRKLASAELDYDIIGLSFYPFWDGNLTNMGNVVSKIKNEFEKEVIIAETSYVYTSEDGDGFGNSVVGNNDLNPNYPATVQGQVDAVRDVIETAATNGALGVFYWEGTWIPVGSDRASNEKLWEEFGSGWASSYSSDYDPEDAGLYYGGCSWDNQAFFDFTGHPLASLDMWKYLKYGSYTE